MVAWNRELTAAHARLRTALAGARESLEAGSLSHDLLSHCHGFCSALRVHHEREDAALFPELVAQHPELVATIAKLEQDHAAIAALLRDFDTALASPTSDVETHLDGLNAIMESHFRYEERQLLAVLEALDLEADPREVLG